MEGVEQRDELVQNRHNRTPIGRRDVRPAVTTLLGVVMSLATVGYLVEKLDWPKVHATFLHLNWIWLLAAWLTFALNYALRTLRFCVLLSVKVPFLKLLPIASLHGMFNYLMPAKSGELSFLLLLNRRLQVSFAESTATLVAARFFDFATVALFLPIVLLVFWQRLPTPMIYISLAFCGLVYVLLAAVLCFLRRPTIYFPHFAGNRVSPNRVLHRLVSAWQSLVESLRSIDRRGNYGRLWLLTVSIWLCVYTNLYFILLSLGHQLGYFHVTVISLITVPVTLLPVRGLANLGTHEASWVGALMLFGQNKETALNVAVSAHVVLLMFILLIGLGGLIMSLLDVCSNRLSTSSIWRAGR